MRKYDLIILITFHECKECLLDLIENIKKFNKQKIAIFVSDGTEYEIPEMESIHVIKRQQQIADRFGTLIPLHIELMNYIKQKNIVSDYILLLSSNQMFVRSGFFEFIKNYDYGYYNKINTYNMPSIFNHRISKNYYTDLGLENFSHHSNHDGMFFKYEIFKQMIEYFRHFKDTCLPTHQEEFFYIAYLKKNIGFCNSTTFDEYCVIQLSAISVTIDQINDAIETKKFIVKRIPRIFDDNVRSYIRNLP